MQLIPAIDLLDGQCVRLLHGNFNEVTAYPLDPLELATRYQAEGAGCLHVVDLAAARDGEAADTRHLFRLLERSPLPVQAGGGVRSGGDIEARLANGAARVVVGSRCVTSTPRFLKWLERYGPERLVAALDVSIDAYGVPWPRIHGWTEAAEMNLWQLLEPLAGGGLRHLLVTDIGRDGALHGPNLELYRELQVRYPGLALQASGGIASLEDLLALRATGAAAAISGKALLDGVFTLAEGLEVLA